MKSGFTEVQQQAVKEKVEQLKKVKEGVLQPQVLADKITKRRVDWFQLHKGEILRRYQGLSSVEIAYRAICFDHMGINPGDSRISWLAEHKLRIESHNFCPYLEACKILGMDTRYVCKVIGEPSIQAVCSLINHQLRFSRNYEHIRPWAPYCEEFIEII